MTNEFNDVEQRLTHLMQATQGIVPRQDFESRVMRSVRQSAANDFTRVAWRMGRYVLMASALVVVSSVFLAVHEQSLDDDQQAMAYGTVDVEW